MIIGVIVRRCFGFEYRITCYICDTGKVRYGPSAWTRVHKCYDKESYIPSYKYGRLEGMEIAKKRAKTTESKEFIQKQIDSLTEQFKEDAIKEAKDKWEQSFVRWKDMMEDTIEEFLDLAAKKKCASYGGPGTICAKWEIRNVDVTEEIIEIEG